MSNIPDGFRICTCCNGKGYVRTGKSQQALIDLEEQLVVLDTIEDKLRCILRQPFTLEAVMTIVERHESAHGTYRTDPDRIEYTLLNWETDGVVVFNSLTGQYLINNEQYKEVD